MRGEIPVVEGFEIVKVGEIRGWVRPEARPWAVHVLEQGLSLYEAAARDPDARELQGRGPVYVIRARLPKRNGDPGVGHWAVRHYHRGGHVASLLGDRYLRAGRPRPLREILASEAARRRGIPTPRIVAGVTYPRGRFYLADLVSHFVPDSRDLAEVLFQSPAGPVAGAPERLDALRAAGRLVRQLADAGMHHPDLNAKNILLEWTGAIPTPHLLDLDRCRVAPEGTSVPAEPMHRRLCRSLRKWERRTGVHLAPREWGALKEAAGL